MTHCVRWGSPTPQWIGRFGVEPPSVNMQIAAATCRIKTRSDSAVFQITLDLLSLDTTYVLVTAPLLATD